jgi:succinate dehydrogenase hydrophobic anchor subunit
MGGTRSWTWHMAAAVVLLFVLGMHMLIMHMAGTGHWFAPYGTEPSSMRNSLFRDENLFFTFAYILLLGVALYHGLYGFRTIVFELTLKPATEKAISIALVVLGLGLFGLGTWAALVAHRIALAGAGG